MFIVSIYILFFLQNSSESCLKCFHETGLERRKECFDFMLNLI